MKTIMYVLQDEGGRFFWKKKTTSTFEGFSDDFADAYLFKTEKGAKQSMNRDPNYSNCIIRKVEIRLVKE